MSILPNSTLSRYVGMANSFPKFSCEQELELWYKWRHGLDVRAKEAFIRANLRHVVSMALKYRRYELPLSELIAEGNFGLVHALSRFAPELGNRFVTYAAYWIRAYILDYIIRSWSLVGVGTGPLRSKLFFKLRRESARIRTLVGDYDYANVLPAESLGVSHDQMVGMLQRLESRDVSLNRSAIDGSPVSLLDTLPSPNCSQEQAYQDAQDDRHRHDIVRTAFNVLDRREKLIVKYRLMRDSEDELSLADIGRLMGVSRERARQLETRAKLKLRRRILELSRQWDLHDIGVDSAA